MRRPREGVTAIAGLPWQAQVCSLHWSRLVEDKAVRSAHWHACGTRDFIKMASPSVTFAAWCPLLARCPIFCRAGFRPARWAPKAHWGSPFDSESCFLSRWVSSRVLGPAVRTKQCDLSIGMPVAREMQQFQRSRDNMYIYIYTHIYSFSACRACFISQTASVCMPSARVRKRTNSTRPHEHSQREGWEGTS
jgi:hypothetical protein